jgi:mono/diheme cytochrome c family protein
MALCFCESASGAFAQAPADSQTKLPHATFVKRYCITCHNDRLRVAELSLQDTGAKPLADDATRWEEVVHKLRARQMPPAGVPRPDEAAYRSIVEYLETELDTAAAANPNPGRPTVHRLNRAEYVNAIRDLLAVEIDGATMLPPDDSGYGFDNIGDVLSVTPMLLERYLAAAARITRLALGDPSLKPGTVSFSLPEALRQDERMNEQMPLGTRGGMAVRHHFPLDAEYVVQVKLQRNRGGNIIGINRKKQVEVRLDGARLKLFEVGGGGKPAAENAPRYGLPPEPGAASQQPANPTNPADQGVETYESTADKDLEVRFPARSGTHEITVAFLKDTVRPEGVMDRAYDRAFFEGLGSITILGPYDASGPGESESRKRVFVCLPSGPSEEDGCARRILSAFARRAFRRPVASQEVTALMVPYQEKKKSNGFEFAVRFAIQRILVSPEFLFRIERDPAGIAPGTPYQLSDVELASRLSFFLWSSIPDEELLSLAEAGRLRQLGVLDAQIRRMIADKRSSSLVSNFVGQWLYTRNLGHILPDPEAFPNFDENLRLAMQQETEMFFVSMLREDRSILNILDADYTFLNERLAEHYGIPGIQGNGFRRVALTDENRRGLLGQGSVLTVTSYANRTSPTLRGKWLLENLLGAPPPPPPPDVPSLPESTGERALTMRERMEQHRVNPACAACHATMDPMGFALENFDGLGRWRTTSATPGNPVGSPIDATGKLPDGTQFNGPAGLRRIILARQDQFIHAFTERLLTYALGRGVEAYDQPVIRKISRESATADYRWSVVITNIAKSMPFQMRRSRQP